MDKSCTSDRVIRRSAPETDCPASCLAMFSTRHSLVGIDLFKNLSWLLNKGSAIDVGVGKFINYTIVPALEKGEAVNAEFPIVNTDRSAGTMLSNEISKVYKDAGLPRPMNVN